MTPIWKHCTIQERYLLINVHLNDQESILMKSREGIALILLFIKLLYICGKKTIFIFYDKAKKW